MKSRGGGAGFYVRGEGGCGSHSLATDPLQKERISGASKAVRAPEMYFSVLHFFADIFVSVFSNEN